MQIDYMQIDYDFSHVSDYGSDSSYDSDYVSEYVYDSVSSLDPLDPYNDMNMMQTSAASQTPIVLGELLCLILPSLPILSHLSL